MSPFSTSDLRRASRLARTLTLVTAWATACAATFAPVATTGCGSFDCECVWEGGQTFTLNAASRDGDAVFLDLTVTGQPCCESSWEEDEIVRIDLSGYTSGDVVAKAADDLAGAALSVDASHEIALGDLNLVLQPATGDLSVSDSAPQAFLILAADSRAELGKVSVPGGPALH